jgi:hypothetical protein
LTDVRILALGVLNNPRGTFTVNKNARAFLHPPGVEMTSVQVNSRERSRSDYSYERLTHPFPASSHAEYPFYTPGGGDKRWLMSESGNLEEEGQQWVGGLMLALDRSFDAFPAAYIVTLSHVSQAHSPDHKSSNEHAVGRTFFARP